MVVCGTCGCGEAYHGRKGLCRVKGCGCLGWQPVVAEEIHPEDTLQAQTNYTPFRASESAYPHPSPSEEILEAPEGSQRPSRGIPSGHLTGSPEMRAIREEKSDRAFKRLKEERTILRHELAQAQERALDRVIVLLVTHGYLKAAELVATTLSGTCEPKANECGSEVRPVGLLEVA